MAGARLDWHGDRAERRIDAAIADGLTTAAEHLLGASRALAPIEEGTLARSSVASVDRSALKAAVSYDTVYAARQHEELTWRHDPGRQAKYLEQPAINERAAIRGLIAAAIKRALS